jgi:uncharacterized membrane protein
MNQAPKSTGLKENIASLLCYLGWWVTGIIFLIIEPNNKTVKFHAIQSIVVFILITILQIILMIIPIIGWIIAIFVWIGAVILWAMLMYKAYQGGTYHLPIAGNIADKFVK